MASPFSIRALTDHVTLDESGSSQVGFVVTNLQTVPVTGSASPVGEDGTQPGWLSVLGSSQHLFSPRAEFQFDVAVHVPAATQPGDYRFHLVVADVSNPDDNFTIGSPVTFTVSPPPPPPPPGVQPGYLPALLGALAGDLVVGVLSAVPILLFALVRSSSIGAFIAALLVLVGGLLIGTVVGAALGAWLALRLTGYRYGGWTGLLVAPIQLVLLLLVVLVASAAGRAPGAVAVPIDVLAAMLAAVVPPLAARAVVLWRVGAFVPPWRGWTHLTQASA